MGVPKVESRKERRTDGLKGKKEESRVQADGSADHEDWGGGTSVVTGTLRG